MTGKVQQRLLCVGQFGPAEDVVVGAVSAATGPAWATAPSGPADAYACVPPEPALPAAPWPSALPPAQAPVACAGDGDASPPAVAEHRIGGEFSTEDIDSHSASLLQWQ